MEVHRYPATAQRYHAARPHHHAQHAHGDGTLPPQHGDMTSGAQMAYSAAPHFETAYGEPAAVPPDAQHRYMAADFGGTPIKTEFSSKRPDVVISPAAHNLRVALKHEASSGGDDDGATSASDVSSTPGMFNVMRDASNLPLNNFHFAQQHYAAAGRLHMPSLGGSEIQLADLRGASSASSSCASSSAASVVSAKDAALLAPASAGGGATDGFLPARAQFALQCSAGGGVYVDQPTTSASSASSSVTSSTSSVFVADRKRPYPCTLCPSKFGSKMELEEHQNSHTGMKPFQCDVCHSRFNRRSTLWNHKRIHSDAKPFVCTVCQMTFKWKNSLKCHKEMHYRKNETSSIQDNDILTYATAAKKQLKVSNSSGGCSSRSNVLNFGGGTRKHQRSMSTSMAPERVPATTAAVKKSSAPSCNAPAGGSAAHATAGGANYHSTMEFCTESVIRHPHNYLAQQQQIVVAPDHNNKRILQDAYCISQQQPQQRRQQMDSSKFMDAESKSVIHNNNNNNNNNDNISDNNNDNSVAGGGGCSDGRRSFGGTAKSGGSSCEDTLCVSQPPLAPHHYDPPFFASLEHCTSELNPFDIHAPYGLGGAVLPSYDDSFFNGYHQILNPALLSAAAAAAVNYSDVVDPFAYANATLGAGSDLAAVDGGAAAGGGVYGALHHNDGPKLFDAPPMTVIQDGGAFPGTTATALVHEGGYLNYR